MFRVTEDFADLDDVWIEEGTLADQLLDRGGNEDSGFYNLIRDGAVIAVTDYPPPVERYGSPGLL
ncbi:hypothetical protein [Devosia sp. 2618]|uniref:hypothetical protein n=1 Tax=Devosia sp. 2618 TaxID=3156454 RepID=UPI00339B1485